MSQVIEAWMNGIRFYVEPSHFVVHLPHSSQKEDSAVAKYAKETNSQMLHQFYEDSHSHWVKQSRLRTPFWTRAMYSITKKTTKISSRVLEFNCGDFIEIDDASSSSTFWIGRNNRTRHFGAVVPPALSLSWQEGVWCPQKEMLPQFIRRQSQSL